MALISVSMSLLLPGSTIESPKAKTAGMFAFDTSFLPAFAMLHKWNKLREKTNVKQQVDVQEREYFMFYAKTNSRGFKMLAQSNFNQIQYEQLRPKVTFMLCVGLLIFS